MAFNSLQFWLIFPIIFIFYWLIPIKYVKVRKLFLICVSYLLYMNWKPAFALVLLGVTIITYWGGLVFGKELKGRTMKKYVWLFAFASLLPLLIFKYYNFLNESITQGLEFIGFHFSLPGLNWAIPIGISFFTFQSIGYMLDVYYKRIESEISLIDYTLFVSFFPQIASGPISKADEFLPQIKAPHNFNYEQGKQGLKYLIWGMFIKLVIADRSGIFVDTVFSNYIHYNGTTCFVASILYTIQIYCDFAGYSLMAIGIARTLGFNLINNFNRPYFASSITEFWKRWHISLTRWLTQQIYIPLGGSRCSNARCYLNIFLTFLASGIWHGANWTFIFWGTIHGVVQIFEKHFGLQKYTGTNAFIQIIRIGISFFIVSFAWIFFRMPSINDAFFFIIKIFTNFGVPAVLEMGGSALGMLMCGLFILFFKDLYDELNWNIKNVTLYKPLLWCYYVLLFCLIISCGVLDGGQFIYVSF